LYSKLYTKNPEKKQKSVLQIHGWLPCATYKTYNEFSASQHPEMLHSLLYQLLSVKLT